MAKAPKLTANKKQAPMWRESIFQRAQSRVDATSAAVGTAKPQRGIDERAAPIDAWVTVATRNEAV